ncbi:MAG TPA: hypothetical protein VJ836_02600 [Candidatus Saccharimonadales bacterium]|nr:hypothetical protein [Candidatus Saccharimonadales bacterium]
MGSGDSGSVYLGAWYFDPNSAYDIAYINDDYIDIYKIALILKDDPIVTDFHDLSVEIEEDTLVISDNGREVRIKVTQGQIESAPWLGVPDYLFECSGITRNHSNIHNLVSGNTQNVLVGAVIDNADATLVMGANHRDYNKTTDKVISFGSCTVVPGVNVISWADNLLGVKHASVNIVHSVAKWQLDQGRWTTIERKSCSLEKVVPQAVHTLTPKQIKVNYTYAPYYGPSLMDFEIAVSKEVTVEEFIKLLTNEVNNGSFKNLVSLTEVDDGTDNHIHSRFSIDIVKSSIDIHDERIFFHGYFNNEGSGIRLHELAEYVIEQNKG